MQDITTTNLSDFGPRELEKLELLLKAYREQGLPYYFNNSDVVAMMNKNSGEVFLTNSDFQAAMLNGDKLEIWHTCSNCGHEGFLEDFEHEGGEDCQEQIKWATAEGN